MNMRICIITFSHSEPSLCLSKALAALGNEVDFYFITDVIKRRGYVAGFDFRQAPKKIGLVHLDWDRHIPELKEWASGIKLSINLFAVPIIRKQTNFLTKYYFRYLGSKLSKKNYDAYNVIGQNDLLVEIHKALKGKNVIHSFHEVGNHMNGTFNTKLVDYVIRNNLKTILYSKATYTRFINHISSENYDRVTHIPFGLFETLLLYRKPVDMEIPLDLSKTTFLFLGYIVPYKGLDILLSAVEMLKDKKDKFNLIIAGAGNDPILSKFLSLDNVRIINRYLDNDEMLSLISKATCVVMPYKSASQSGIIPTVFMLGKPIVATDVGAITESVQDMRNGLIAKPNDPYGFARKMELIINDKSLVNKLSDQCMKYGHGDDFDWKVIAQKTYNFYFDVKQNSDTAYSS